MDLSPPPSPDPERRPSAVFHTWQGDTPELIAESVAALREAGFGALVFQPREERGGDVGAWADRLQACLSAAEVDGEWPLRVWLGEDTVDAAVRERAGDGATVSPVGVRIELCATTDRARALSVKEDALGVYVGVLANGTTLSGLEPWGEEVAPPNGDDEVLLVARRVALPSGQAQVLPSRAYMAAVADVLDGLEVRFGVSIRDGALRGMVWHLPEAGEAWSGCAPWCEELSAVFEAGWGESLEPLLPFLWFDGPGASTFRLRYRTSVAELYRKRVLEAVGEWCRAHGVLLAVMEGRSDLVSQLRHGPGPAGALLEMADIPSVAATDSAHVLASRQARSIGRQVGCERLWRRGMYRAGRGSALRQFASDARRAIVEGASSVQTEWATASLRGDAGRLGAGAPLRREQPWWQGLRGWADEVARLSQWLAESRRRAEVLVLSPAESMMALERFAAPKGLGSPAPESAALRSDDISDAFEALLSGLDVLQVDYDIVEEQTLADVGRVRANAILVGQADYSVLVAPPALSWREETVQAIRRYARRGGAAILVEPIAAQVDFEPSDALGAIRDEFLNVFTVERAGRDAAYQIRRLDPPAVQVRDLGDTGANDLLVLHHTDDVYDCFCLMNGAPTGVIQAQCRIDSEGVVRRIDAARGETGVMYARQDGGAQVIEHLLPPGGLLVLAVGGEQADLSEPAAATSPAATSTLTLGSEWRFERTAPNALPLRHCAYDLGDRRANVPRPVDLVRAEFLSTPEMADRRRIQLRFPFRSELLMPRGIQLVVPCSEDLELHVNGDPVEAVWEACSEFSGWDAIEVTDMIRPGDNEVALSVPARLSAFEAPFLLGDCAVRIDEDGASVLIEEPASLNNGPWSEQGYPFYTGAMRYRQDFHLDAQKKHRVFLRVASPSGSVIEARIGEHAAVALADPPHRVEITRLLVPGGNRVEITLAGGLANAFGPTHVASRAVEQSIVSPDVYDLVPAENRRLLEKTPRLEAIGLAGGVHIETYDPDAPKPPARPRKESPDEESGQAD